MHNGSKKGMYASNAKSEYVDYIKPQEHGNHYDTNYLNLGEYSFVSQQGFEFNISQYSTSQLDNKMHNYELEKSKYTNVRIDYKVSGIGSNSCGPKLLEKYQMNDSKVEFKFSILKN